MAKILQCPSCRQGMDVTGVEAGSTVQCPDCGKTTMVPSGATSVRTKTVSAPIPAQRPASSNQLRSASATRPARAVNRSRSGTMPLPPQSEKSHGGLFIGLGIGVLGIVVILFVMKEQKQDDAPRKPVAQEKKGPGSVTFSPNLPAMSDKPIVLGEGNKADPKPTTLSKPAETVDNANWVQLMKDLRPGGGFEHLDRPEGVAFQRVKSFGPAAYPKLISFIDDEDPVIGIAAVSVLNELTGRSEPAPKGINKAKSRAEWEEWLKNSGGGAAKPADPKK